MSIVLHLGRNVNEYRTESGKIIKLALDEKEFLCEQCFRAMGRHSSYYRDIREIDENIEITVIWCRRCKIWHALLPDFLLRNKHYSGNEIESVIIDSETMPANQIETNASEATVKRWINQIGDRIREAISKLKLLFGQAGQAVCEIKINAGHCYNELEQVLEMAPAEIKYSGNKLGLANIWLRRSEVAHYI